MVLVASQKVGEDLSMCRHSYYYEGCRTYGSNIPTFAQGAYFPGDEPGVRCKLYDYCEDPETCPDNTDNGGDDYERRAEK